VTGLVAVGSMASVDYEPDQWSDHDFFVITPSGGQEALRAELSWLPFQGELAFSFRETEHGLKVLYADGHLLEFAVFDLEEVALAAVNRYRVLLDRGGVEERLRELAARSPDDWSDDYLFGMFVASVQVGLGRAARGERLSGHFFVLWGARYLCVFLARVVPSDGHGVLDGYDPLRRFERAYPDLGAEIERAVRDEPPALFEIAERELRPLRPELPWQLLDAVRARTQSGSGTA